MVKVIKEMTGITMAKATKEVTGITMARATKEMTGITMVLRHLNSLVEVKIKVCFPVEEIHKAYFLVMADMVAENEYRLSWPWVIDR
jgi:hypothetical protein